MKDFMRKNCVGDWKRKRERGDVKGNERCHKKEYVCTWLGEDQKKNRCEGE
jgi:hypothetical protein